MTILHTARLCQYEGRGKREKIREDKNTQRLTQEQADEHRQRHVHQARRLDIAKSDTRVHESEERQDHVADHRVQAIRNCLQRADRLVRQHMDIVQHLDLHRRQDRGTLARLHLIAVQHGQQVRHIFREGLQLHHRTGRDRESDQHASDRRVNSGLEEQQPNHETKRIIEQPVIDPHLAAEIQDSQDHQRDQQRLESDVSAIEQGDDDDTTDIVDHR